MSPSYSLYITQLFNTKLVRVLLVYHGDHFRELNYSQILHIKLQLYLITTASTSEFLSPPVILRSQVVD